MLDEFVCQAIPAEKRPKATSAARIGERVQNSGIVVQDGQDAVISANGDGSAAALGELQSRLMALPTEQLLAALNELDLTPSERRVLQDVLKQRRDACTEEVRRLNQVLNTA